MSSAIQVGPGKFIMRFEPEADADGSKVPGFIASCEGFLRSI